MRNSYARYRWSFIVCALLMACAAPGRATAAAVKLTKTEWHKFNTLFSNYSEALVPSFKRGEVNDETLIWFGFLHERINGKRQQQHMVHGKFVVSAKRVEALAQWYFGASVGRHRTIHRWVHYRNGSYHCSTGDGDPTPFSQVVRLRDSGNGLHTADLNIYEAHDSDPQGNYSPEKNAHGDTWTSPRFVERRQAIIRQVGSGARRRWILVEHDKR